MYQLLLWVYLPNLNRLLSYINLHSLDMTTTQKVSLDWLFVNLSFICKNCVPNKYFIISHVSLSAILSFYFNTLWRKILYKMWLLLV